MRLLVLFFAGLMLINIGLRGHLGDYLGALITPDYMSEI